VRGLASCTPAAGDVSWEIVSAVVLVLAYAIIFFGPMIVPLL
jgi:hypothetical protein